MPSLLRLPADGRTVTLPHGRTLHIAGRGVYWEANTNGDCFTVYLVDSLGDRRGTGVNVAAGAPDTIFAAAEAEMWALLERLDPPPLQLVR